MEESKAVTVAPNNKPAILTPEVIATRLLSFYSDKKLTDLPTIKLKHPSAENKDCPKDVNDGDLYATEGSVISNPYKFLPIFGFKYNINWNSNKVPGDTAPTCKSYDQIHSDGRSTKIFECNNCPYHPLLEFQTKVKACRTHWMFVTLSSEKEVYLLDFGGTEFNEAKDRLNKYADTQSRKYAIGKTPMLIAMTTEKAQQKDYSGAMRTFWKKVVQMTTEETTDLPLMIEILKPLFLEQFQKLNETNIASKNRNTGIPTAQGDVIIDVAKKDNGEVDYEAEFAKTEV